MPPKIIEEKSTINPATLSEGETLRLFCHVDGSPIPKVSWYFRKKISSNELTNEQQLIYVDKITNFHDYNNMIPIHEGNTLVVENITRNYSGYFECIANNSVLPSASRKIKVTVECNYRFFCN